MGISSAHRLLVIADPPCLMSRFLKTETAFVKSTQTQHTWDAAHEKIRVLAMLLKWVVEDSSNLVDDMTSKAREMTYRGRRMPTRSKIQYLIHLDDCRRLAISDLKHGKTVVDEARLTVEKADFCCKKKGGLDEAMAIKTFSSFHDDFNFLIMKFETPEMTLATVREQINEQMSLARGERALILTIAAAFFIPLSFIASIFGMDVKEPLFPPSKSRSKTASKTTTTTPTISSIPIASVDPSQPSQHYWTMSQYLEISLPLTVGVILLPLIAGPWLRLASQQYDVNRRHWRALFVVFSACYFVGLLVAFYIGSRSYDTRNYSDYIATMLYLAAGYSVTAVIGIARMVGASRNKKGRLRWTLLLLMSGAFVVADLSSLGGYVPYAIFPYLYMFMTSKMSVRYLKRTWSRLNRKDKRQSVAQYTSVTQV
ncbi:hypothetical protein KCU61_g3062, partial [Aureobasidium melanogenum]